MQHAPLWAAALLVLGLGLHILGGTIGILSGYAAVAVKKGADFHRGAGMAFVLGMLVMASAAVALAVPLQERSNLAGGFLEREIRRCAVVGIGWSGVIAKADSLVEKTGVSAVVDEGFKVSIPHRQPGELLEANFRIRRIARGVAAVIGLHV